MEMSQNCNHKKCKDHYEHLVFRKKLDLLKSDGSVVATQPTKTNMSAITVTQQRRCYLTLEDTWAK